MARKRKAHKKGVAGHIASFKKVKKHSTKASRKAAHKRSRKG